MTEDAAGRVLVTGASGYIGGRLVPELLCRGHTVRCLVRTPRKLDRTPWRAKTDVVQGDIGGDLTEAMAGVDTAVFLVHSIGEGTDWTSRELRHAENFRFAAEQAGVGRIVYLGVLGDDAPQVSDHLRTRHQVGEILAPGPDPGRPAAGRGRHRLRVGQLRDAPVSHRGVARHGHAQVGAHPMPTHLGARRPALPGRCHRASRTDHPGVLEIGEPDVVSYAEMMAIYAEEAGLVRRRLIPVPFLTPRLSSYWVGLVTPVPASLARPLVASLVTTVVVTDDRATRTFPFERVPLRVAIRQAIGGRAAGEVATWFDDASLPVWQALPTDPAWSGGTELTDYRAKEVRADVTPRWRAVCRVGGERGWYSGEWLWRLRGWLDRVAGGPGLRRGRRRPDQLAVGEPLDFWRVEDLDEERSLRLHAEMFLPGETWLEWTLRPVTGGTELVQTARFRPRGLLGRA